MRLFGPLGPGGAPRVSYYESRRGGRCLGSVVPAGETGGAALGRRAGCESAAVVVLCRDVSAFRQGRGGVRRLLSLDARLSVNKETGSS